LTTKIRFGEYLREAQLQQRLISANDLAKVQGNYAGQASGVRSDLDITAVDIHRLAFPYVSVRAKEQIKAVVPLALYLMLFQILIFRQSIAQAEIIFLGLLAVVLGLMLFMEGLKIGLMPFGEVLGGTLPAKSTLPVVLLVTFVLGIGVTFAEPAIGALRVAGQSVEVEQAPYLYALLNSWADVMVLLVGCGVGIAAVLGTIRLLYGWSLKPFIYATLLPLLLLTFYIQQIPELSEIVALAWDSGAVTTGPVTVPLVLSLGIGIASAAGKGNSSLSGFGIVTLASLFPIIGVELLSLYLYFTVSPEEIIAAASASELVETSWHQGTPFVEIIGGIQAIVPLVLFLLFVLYVICHEKIRNGAHISYGIILSVLGMIIFNLGLTYGLSNLGGQSGGFIPATFTQIALVENSPLYSVAVGLMIAFVFAWCLGFGATLAEPALNALGSTVEDLTNGSFRKSVLMYAVSLGVGFGIALGVAKIIYDFNVAYVIIPLYTLSLIMTWLSSEEFVNVAWDSAGVTTGPITVPLVLSMGVGFANSSSVVEGFGILAMASIGPILAVLATGLWVDWKLNRKRKINADETVN